ncbi:MAG: hypothetical protein CH6_2309 [Candidatus Kapaibacterium sp.]|nr:MAG: hypothetical protein CH6_2309 [Candidatus Kapabacteria bacterium]
MGDFSRKIFFTLLGKVFRNKPKSVPLEVSKNAKILIFRYDKIGDMVVSLPSFEFLKEKFHDSEIWVLASPINFFLLENYPYVDHFVVLHKGIFKKIKTLLQLRKVKFDFIINYVFYRTTKAGLWANLINPKAIKVNMGHNTRNEIYSKLFNVLYPISLRGKIPMSELLCQYICWLFGFPYDKEISKSYFINVPPESLETARRFISTVPGSRKILINISARRKWSSENYKRLVSLIIQDFKDLGIIFVAHPSDYETLDEIVQNFNNNVFAFKSGKDFLDAIALVSLVDLVFTPDTSIVHFANAFGKPIAMMYYEKDSYLNEWIPNKSKFICFVSGCSNNYNDISPEDAFEGIKALLE